MWIISQKGQVITCTLAPLLNLRLSQLRERPTYERNFHVSYVTLVTLTWSVCNKDHMNEDLFHFYWIPLLRKVSLVKYRILNQIWLIGYFLVILANGIRFSASCHVLWEKHENKQRTNRICTIYTIYRISYHFIYQRTSTCDNSMLYTLFFQLISV